MKLLQPLALTILAALSLVSVQPGVSHAQNGPQQTPATDIATLTILTRTVIIALNQANQTGNYAVLRDIGSPGFIAGNTPASLAIAFTDLRNRTLDLSPVVLFDPQFTQQPIIDQAGRLRLAGYFPTRPVRINFELHFDNIGGRWRLFGLSVNPSAAPAQPQVPPAGQAPAATQQPQSVPPEPAPEAQPDENPTPSPRVNPLRFEQ